MKGINNVLDKDIRVPGNKIYSPQTCMFVTKSQSSSDVQRNHPGKIHSVESFEKISKPVRAVRLSDGIVKCYKSIMEAEKDLGINHSNISRVV